MLASPEEVAGIIVEAEPLELACLGRSGPAAVAPEVSASAGRAIASGKVRLIVQVTAE